MCESNADDGVNYLEPRPSPLQVGTMCRKCHDQKAQVVLQIRDAYCRDCFLALCSHKFRGLLGKTRVLHGGTERRVLVAFSGSSSSLTLLHLLRDATSAELGHRRLLAVPSAIYIDEGAVLGLGLEAREQQCREVLAQLQTCGVPAYVVSLTLGEVAPKQLSTSGANVNSDGDEQVSALFTSLPDLSSKLDMLKRIRTRVLAAAARQLDTDSVMLAENATSLASAILVSICLGRGASVPLETGLKSGSLDAQGFLDTREDGVRFIRPLKELGSKEVAYFAKFRGLQPVFIPSLLTQTDIDGSIQRLTEDFVVSLQSQFPSTVATISRTGDKLHVQREGSCCALCRAPLDTETRDCSAMDATAFSKSLSTSAADSKCSKACSCKASLLVEDALPALCYACRLLTVKLSSVDLLPRNTIAAIQEQLSFQHMRSQIQDFLLE